MSKEGETTIGVNRKVPRGGVAVLKVDERSGEDVSGEVVFRSRTQGIADEFMVQGVTRSLNKRGEDASIVFNEDEFCGS